MSARPVNTILTALERAGCKLTRDGDGWRTSCPSSNHPHGNRKNPALSISEGADGRALLCCHAGCGVDDVLGALGLEPAALFPDGGDKTPRAPKKPARGEQKPRYLPGEPVGKDGVTRFPYRDATGRTVIFVRRIEEGDPDPETGKRAKRFIQYHYDGKGWLAGLGPWKERPRPLFRLPFILKHPDAPVVMHEGEKAALAALKARLHGEHTTTIGGAGNAHKSDFTALAGRVVFIVPDADEAGEKHARQVAELAHEAGAAKVAIVTLPDVPEKGDVVEWLEAGGTPEAWRDLLAKAEPFTAEEKAADGDLAASKNGPRVVAVGIGDLLAMELPRREPLLAPWLPEQGLAMIHAYRGVGKTHVSLGIAVAVASGGAFLNWQAPKPAGVLFLDGEMPARTLQERLAAIIAREDKEPVEPLRIITPDLQPLGMPNLATLEGQEAIEPHLEGVRLVIVDNISTLCRGGRENEAESWLPVQEWALGLRARGFAVLFIHHSGKGGNQRGTSKREDVLDTVIALRRPADYTPEQGATFEVHYEKARGCMGDDVRAFEAQLRPEGWLTRTLEESLTEKVAALLREGHTQTDIAEELGVNRSTVYRHMKKARQSGKLKVVEGGRSDD